jgi:hypothetical protein
MEKGRMVIMILTVLHEGGISLYTVVTVLPDVRESGSAHHVVIGRARRLVVQLRPVFGWLKIWSVLLLLLLLLVVVNVMVIKL